MPDTDGDATHIDLVLTTFAEALSGAGLADGLLTPGDEERAIWP